MEINEHEKPIDVINYKLSKLNSMFDGLSAIAYDEALLYKEPNFKKREELERKKQHENRQLNLFAGMYSLKSVIYKDKTKVPPPISLVSSLFFVIKSYFFSLKGFNFFI